MEIDKTGIAGRLKELRKALGLTQKEFAEHVGRTLRAIQRYESGQRSPDETTLRLIEQIFSVNPEWLRKGKGEMFIEKEESSLEKLLKEFSEEEVEAVILALRIVRKLEKKKGMKLNTKQRVKVARLLIELLEADESIEKLKGKLEKKGEKLLEALTV
ncbi:MAG: helix-turn-helix domain-containing protein [Desulfurobacteriaceae bacterium]